MIIIGAIILIIFFWGTTELASLLDDYLIDNLYNKSKFDSIVIIMFVLEIAIILQIIFDLNLEI